MKRSTLSKLALAFAICCAVVCAIAIAPVVIAAIIAIFTFFCLLCCVVIIIAGLFVWLFTIGQVSIFSYGTAIAEFAIGLFDFITPIAKFSFTYITPIAGGIAIALGVFGIIFASIVIAKANKQITETGNQAESIEEPAPAEESVLPATASETSEAEPKKKKKAKKQKTEKGSGVASLVISIVFTVVAAIAIVVAVFAVSLF